MGSNKERPQPCSSGVTPRENSLIAEINALKEKVWHLQSDLGKSENLRKKMELTMEGLLRHQTANSVMEEVVNFKSTCSLGDETDSNMGLLWNLSTKGDCFRILNSELGKLSHASRRSGEHPMVIMSRRQLEVASFPVKEQIELSWAELNEEVKSKTNMVGHIVVPQEEVDVTAGFAGALGNLFWFNSGQCDLLLRLITGKVVKSIVLAPGFGFSMGKRERYTKVFLSSFDKAVNKFVEEDGCKLLAHAIFLGCDMGDQGSWLEELNTKIQAVEYKLKVSSPSNEQAKKLTKDNNRNRRLGIKLKNPKRSWIRIAPVKDSNIKPGLLSEKVREVDRWIHDTLGKIRSNALPKKFSVVSAKEIPRVGDPFDVLWVKFEFDDSLWDDEVMWDIRYLLMGSKLDKILGFPHSLRDIREKLFISRDGISERVHRGRWD